MSKLRVLSASTAQRQLIAECTSVLMSHGLVIIPTDTVYGISCLAEAHNPAYTQIFALKHRPDQQTLPWLIASSDELERYAQELSFEARALAKRLWPGALTLIVKASAQVPQEYQGPNNTIALRVPDHAFLRELSRSCGAPLATTSANIHSAPAACCVEELSPQLLQGVDLVLDGGKTTGAQASTIVDCTSPEAHIVRHGAISDDQIARTHASL